MLGEGNFREQDRTSQGNTLTSSSEPLIVEAHSLTASTVFLLIKHIHMGSVISCMLNICVTISEIDREDELTRRARGRPLTEKTSRCGFNKLELLT